MRKFPRRAFYVAALGGAAAVMMPARSSPPASPNGAAVPVPSVDRGLLGHLVRRGGVEGQKSLPLVHGRGWTVRMLDDDESRAISQLIERLVLRFPCLERESVEEAVAAAHRKHDGAPIRTFVHLLVEHDVLAHLKEHARHADGSRHPETDELRVDA